MSDIDTKSRKRKASDDLTTDTCFKRHTINAEKFTMTIRSNVELYELVHTFICDLHVTQNNLNPTFRNIEVLDTGSGEIPKLHYILPRNTWINVIYESSKITFIVQRVSPYYEMCGVVIKCLHEITLIADNKGILDKLILESSDEKETLRISYYNASHGCWDENGTVQKRDESTLILNKEDKVKLFDDIDNFITAEKEYERYGILYKRNYLFHGKPGTGKTSLVNVIANRFNRCINIIPFDAKLTDALLYNAINGITRTGNNTILLLEDIDCIFHDRTSNMNNSKVSFSALLNVLDGVIRTKGLITIVTTNYLNKLDKALVRPGRIDMMIEFTIITREQIEALLLLYTITLEQKTIMDLIKISQKLELTPAVFSGFMFRHRKIILDNTNYLELFKKYLKEIDAAIKQQNEYQKMYT